MIVMKSNKFEKTLSEALEAGRTGQFFAEDAGDYDAQRLNGEDLWSAQSHAG